MGRTRNLKGSAWVGVGGSHIYEDVYKRRGKPWWGDLYTNKYSDTHSETHTDTCTDTHTDTHTVFSPFRGAYIYIWDLWTSRELAVAK